MVLFPTLKKILRRSYIIRKKWIINLPAWADADPGRNQSRDSGQPLVWPGGSGGAELSWPRVVRKRNKLNQDTGPDEVSQSRGREPTSGPSDRLGFPCDWLMTSLSFCFWVSDPVASRNPLRSGTWEALLYFDFNWSVDPGNASLPLTFLSLLSFESAGWLLTVESRWAPPNFPL